MTTYHTLVHHAFLKQDMDRKRIEALQEVPYPGAGGEGYPFFAADRRVWNRMVHILKELAEGFELP